MCGFIKLTKIHTKVFSKTLALKRDQQPFITRGPHYLKNNLQWLKLYQIYRNNQYKNTVLKPKYD